MIVALLILVAYMAVLMWVMLDGDDDEGDWWF